MEGGECGATVVRLIVDQGRARGDASSVRAPGTSEAAASHLTVRGRQPRRKEATAAMQQHVVRICRGGSAVAVSFAANGAIGRGQPS
jgi:hypothetical protein